MVNKIALWTKFYSATAYMGKGLEYHNATVWSKVPQQVQSDLSVLVGIRSYWRRRYYGE